MLAWCSLLGSYLVLIATDYTLRYATGNIKLGGISFLVFWTLWTPFLVYSLYYLFKASKKLQTKLIKILFIIANLIIATFSILIISLLYTIEFGIDSL